MLNRNQKERIMSIRIYEYSHLEKDGIPITFSQHQFIIPTFNEIKDYIFNQILNLGFSKIERVAPSEADCIIRIFQKHHCPYDNIFTYNIYGANCYVQKCGNWITMCNDEKVPIDYSECILRHWIYQDNYIDIDCEFFDCYVKIS